MSINKKGLTWEELTPWMIAIAVLAIVLIFSYLLKDKLAGMIDYIKNLFR